MSIIRHVSYFCDSQIWEASQLITWQLNTAVSDWSIIKITNKTEELAVSNRNVLKWFFLNYRVLNFMISSNQLYVYLQQR